MQSSKPLVELLRVLNDGISFYDEASRRTSNHVYSDVFERLYHLKSAIAADLSTVICSEVVPVQAQPEPDVLSPLRTSYAELLMGMSEHPNHEFIAQIEAQEEHVLDAFRYAVDPGDPPGLHDLAKLYLPEVQRLNNEIRELKGISALESVKA